MSQTLLFCKAPFPMERCIFFCCTRHWQHYKNPPIRPGLIHGCAGEGRSPVDKGLKLEDGLTSGIQSYLRVFGGGHAMAVRDC